MSSNRLGWGILMLATTTWALLSLAPVQVHSVNVLACGNATAPECLGACDPGQGCIDVGVGNSSTCVCAVLGCCQPPAPAPICVDSVAEFECVAGWVAGGTCASGCGVPTATPTVTPTVTPTETPTPAPDGSDCADPADCVSGNCVDDVCCDTACDDPSEACNLPGSIGQCSAIAAPAPAASPGGLFAMLGVLLAVGGFAVLRVRRAGN